MILVFGGTTEGKRVISLLNEMQLPFVYSTKTKTDVELGNFGKYRYGALEIKALTDFILKEKINVIINAAHPFAKELHQTVDKAAQLENTKVFRLERNYSDRMDHELVNYVKDYNEICSVLISDFQEKNLLALTGVQSIEKFKPFWKNNTCYFRILDRTSSIEIASKSEFPQAQLILEQPENLIGGEEQLIDQLKIDVLVTKESGSTGALDRKIEIALNKELPIFILTKPKTPESFIQVQSISELQETLNSNSSFKINNSSLSIIKSSLSLVKSLFKWELHKALNRNSSLKIKNSSLRICNSSFFILHSSFKINES